MFVLNVAVMSVNYAGEFTGTGSMCQLHTELTIITV